MAQYYQIIQNVDGLNLENCVIMNEDGTPISPRSVVLTDQSQIIDNHQIPQIIYQQNAQHPIQTPDGQVHYIVQEEELQNDNYNIVQQTPPPQIYYQKITTENGQQIIQHAKGQADMQNAIEVQQTPQIQYQAAPNQQQQQQPQPQQQQQQVQYVIHNYQQSPQVLQQQHQHHQQQQQQQAQTQQQPQQVNCVIRQAPQMQNTTYYIQQQPQIQTSPPQQQLVQVQTAMQTHQPHAQIGTQQTMQEIQTPPQIHNRIQLPVQNAQMIRNTTGNVRPRFVQRVPPNQIQMATPQKVMQPTGMMQQQIRFQTPVRTPRPAAPPQVRTPRPPRTPAVRARAQTPVRAQANTSQPMATSTPMMQQRQRLTLTRLNNPNQITQVQPIISMSQQKTMVSITTTPTRAPTVTRGQAPVLYNKVLAVSQAQAQLHAQNVVTASTSSVSTAPATAEDLEDSIQAARITKQPTTHPTENFTIVQQSQQQINDNNEHRIITLQSGTQMSIAEYKQRQVAQSGVKQLAGIRPINRGVVQNRQPRFMAPNAVRGPRPVLQQQQPQPQVQAQHQAQLQHNHQMQQQQAEQQQQQQQQMQQQQNVTEKEVRESARMLIVLENGEQRLITFTLPKESCTVHELLEQIGVPFEPDTNIHCVTSPGLNIDYLVTVGVNLTETPTEIITAAENSLQMKHQEQLAYQNTQPQPMQVQVQQQQQQHLHVQQQQSQQQQQQNVTHLPKILQKSSVQALQQIQKIQNQKNNVTITQTNKTQQNTVTPKYIQGCFALCPFCGITSNNHAQCQRCFRIFTEEPKRIPMPTTLANQPKKTTPTANKILTLIEKQNEERMKQIQKRYQVDGVKTIPRRIPVPRANAGSARKRRQEEPVILTLSSDEEDDEKPHANDNERKENMLSFEPICKENVQPNDFNRENVVDLSDVNEKLLAQFTGEKVYLGTHIFQPTDEIVFTSKGLRLVAPHCKHPTEKTVLNIQKSEIVKVVCNFSQKSVLVLYVLNTCGKYIRESLEMSSESQSCGYFSPMSVNQGERRIMIEAEINETAKSVIKSIFSSSILEEISSHDTSIIRMQIKNATSSATSANSDANRGDNGDGVCNILIYPPTGKGGIPINTKDFVCLGIDQYLNDVIIDFYLKYLHNEVLTETQKAKTHIFSTFFYNTLTNTKLLGPSNDVKLTAAQKRHERVKNWTKHVNIFEKDFIIVPINQQSHWFLAIICFPSLKGPVTIDSNQPVKPAPIAKKKPPAERKESVALQIGNTTITPVSKKEIDSICVDEESERDEAEGEESDLESDDSETETAEPQPASHPIKQPCILVFDSLAGASRTRVVATLRDYLTCEYRAKIKNPVDHAFNRYNMMGHSVKVPQQTNFTDCGLYLLQYVESFFTDPIKNYRIPIKHLVEWFDTLVVTKKREDIVNLIKRLMDANNKKILLPEIQLPTENGKLLELPDFSEEHGEFEEEDEGDAECPEEHEQLQSPQSQSQAQSQAQSQSQPHPHPQPQPQPQPQQQQQSQPLPQIEQEKPTPKKRVNARKQANLNDNGEATTKKRRTLN